MSTFASEAKRLFTETVDSLVIRKIDMTANISTGLSEKISRAVEIPDGSVPSQSVGSLVDKPQDIGHK